MMFRLENLCVFGKFLQFLLHNTSDVTSGARSTIPGRGITAGGQKGPSHKHFFQNSTFASKRPQVRTWGRQIVSCPTRHLTSFRPCTMHITIVHLAKMAKFVYKNTCPSVANYHSQNL